MCLIIVSPKGHDVKKAVIQSAMFSNPDGVGIMFDGKIEKYLAPSVEFIHARLLELCDKKFAVHFRMKTHGEVDLENTHPYTLPNGKGYLMHNGILPCGNDWDKTKSDTWHYIRLHLNKGKIDWQSHGATIGSGNKFVFMDKKGNFEIVNKGTGIDYDGAWYSNTYAWDYPRKVRFVKSVGRKNEYPQWDDYASTGNLEFAVISLLETAEKMGLINLPFDPYKMDSNDLSGRIYELESTMLGN